MGVLLVSADKLKAFTNINDNVDEALLLSNIQIAEDIGLQTILGTKFYNHIKSAAQNSTLTGPETTLLQNYIQPYLIHRAYYESIPNIWMRVMNKSITIGNTEQGSAASASDMRYLRNMTQDRYEFYSQRMMDYMKDHSNDFNIYFSYSSNQGMAPSKENYFGGVQISPGFRKLPPMGIKGYLDPSSDLLCCR
jgi:hypothetical protein